MECCGWVLQQALRGARRSERATPRSRLRGALGAGSPLPGGGEQRRPRVPAAGTLPDTVCPPRGRQRPGREGAPAPCSLPPPADLGRRAAGAWVPFPFLGAPGERSPPPTEKHPGCEGQASSYPGRGLPRRWGRVRRSGRRAAAARGSGSDFLLLRLGPAARPRSPARPRPGPPLSAASCGLRRPPAAGPASRLPSVLGRGRWGGGGGGERERD